MDINNEQFVILLRSALHYLYDPDQLRRSPLTIFFDVSNRVDAAFALQKILIDAIEGIRPEENEPPQSRGWLLHDVLFFRYVHGYERHAVANQLGISDRQLSRDQRAALETLAQYLWKTYDLEGSTMSNLSLASSSQPSDSAEGIPVTTAPISRGENDQFSWIGDLPAEKPSVWKYTVLSVLELLRQLISQNEVQFVYEPSAELPDLLVPQNALRHSLLNILGLMIPLAQRGKLFLIPKLNSQALSMTIAIPSSGNPHLLPNASVMSQPSIGVAQQLVERVGGSLHFIEKPEQVEVAFTIPALAQIPVLIIDDNADIIQLFQRYAQGTRYTVVGASGPAEFYQLLDQIHPRIILMDVMMPELDGWDLLSQLRQEKPIQNTAIIICSILPQESLARSLGADSFLQKPVLPQDFLQALDEQMNHLADEPRTGL
jgi:CheY-like chemotaxis protein